MRGSDTPGQSVRRAGPRPRRLGWPGRARSRHRPGRAARPAGRAARRRAVAQPGQPPTARVQTARSYWA